MRRLLLALAAVGLIAFTVVVNPTPAAACSCLGISTRRAAEQAEAVFVGTVTKAEESRIGGERATQLRFDVSRVYKGTVYADQVITTAADSAGCGLTPEVGSTWVIFASGVIQGEGNGGQLRLHHHAVRRQPVGLVAPAGAGPGDPAPAGAVGPDRAGRPTDARLTRGLVIGGVGVLGLGALIGIGLAYLWRPKKT